MLASLWSDIRYAVRGLRHNPAFAVVAILAIALGIGINTGIFSVLNGLALRPLPAQDPHELVSIYQNVRGARTLISRGSSSTFSLREYETYRDHNQTLAGLLAYSNMPQWTVTLGGAEPREISGELVSCNYFDILGQKPAMGAGITGPDCERQDPPPVVLSHALWVSAFASDPNVIGTSIEMNRQIFRVAGIAAPGFHGTEPLQSAFWAPITSQHLLSPSADWVQNDHTSWLNIVGRKKPRIPVERVRADLSVIAAQLDRQEPGRATSLSIYTATSFSEPQVRRALLAGSTVVLVAFGLVLLIACANVANLLLARAAGRRKEIAVRLSIGASRGRLIRQLLTESLLIALTGGALGSWLAFVSFQNLVTFALSRLPAGLPPLAVDATPDLRVFGFALALTFLTGILFGMAPALQASKPDVHATLKDDSAGSGRASGGFLRNALVGSQVAVCMVLLVTAGLLLRGLYVAQTVDPGFEFKNVSVASFDLRNQGYDDAGGAAFQKQVLDRIASMPGVERVAQASVTPLSPGTYNTGFFLPGEQQPHPAEYNPVSSEYFSVIGIPIVRGRTFTSADAGSSPQPVIVTESTARRFWPDQDPIGKTFEMGGPQRRRATRVIVGVAKDAQISRIGETDTVYLYTLAGVGEQRGAQLLVRSSVGFGPIAAAIRAAVRDIDAHLIANVNPLEDNLDFWRSLSRLAATLSGSLGGLALLLASIGVYGVVTYAVSRRIREVGIRLVLGASVQEVLAMVLRQAMLPVLAGAAIGIALAAAASRVLSSILFGVSGLDPLAFALAAGLLLMVALAASLAPALRATRVDPMTTLRYE